MWTAEVGEDAGVAAADFALHPILYVEDAAAERDFYTAFGFVVDFASDDAPGFIALRRAGTVIGISSNGPRPVPALRGAIRWQFVGLPADEVVSIATRHGFVHRDEDDEVAGRRIRLVLVTSPNGIEVVFEDELGAGPAASG